jgi:hypothetical protein
MLYTDAMRIPHKRLSPAALRAVVEEFVTRDGTDYGSVEKTLEEKVAAVMRQLERGDLAILFDPDSGTINIVPRDALRGPGRPGTLPEG